MESHFLRMNRLNYMGNCMLEMLSFLQLMGLAMQASNIQTESNLNRLPLLKDLLKHTWIFIFQPTVGNNDKHPIVYAFLCHSFKNQMQFGPNNALQVESASARTILNIALCVNATNHMCFMW